MLDFDLARIYGYTTKSFNQQVRRNIERFDDDFMFRLTQDEYRQILRSQIVTLEQGKYSKYLPYAFTEQGIYMLMTVLKGDLAIKQSKTLIRLFKQMKDYIADNAALVSRGEFAQLEGRVKDVEGGLKKVMDNFQEPANYKHILFWNGDKFDADVAYTKIYKAAKKSIIVIDDYIGLKTLELLRCVKKGVKINIYSDNKAGRDKLTKNIYDDFVSQ